MKFNTAVSQLMILANNLEAREKLPISVYETFLKLLAPLSPHIAEELWQQLGHKNPFTWKNGLNTIRGLSKKNNLTS